MKTKTETLFILFLVFCLFSVSCRKKDKTDERKAVKQEEKQDSMSYPNVVNVRIFSRYTLTTVLFEPIRGSYQICSHSDTLATIENGDALYATMAGNSINCRTIETDLGFFDSIRIMSDTTAKSDSETAFFRLTPLSKPKIQREYDDNLAIKTINGKLLLINQVAFDKYIAGVVETEGGSGAHKNYYKAQAILCRTYGIKNLDNHSGEGFQLCDDVHCQAYKSRCRRNPEIHNAVKTTSPLIVIDQNAQPISAIFHANCGGQTLNSEALWSKKSSYLKSVIDPYCISQRQAVWEKVISLKSWKRYLRANNIYVPKGLKSKDFVFFQSNRKTCYRFGGDSLNLRKIRHDWKLKSTFFSITPKGNELIIIGRGYGHGVGLCQEGAMKMALLGFSYSDIIHFYYKNVQIVDFEKNRNLFFNNHAKRNR